MLKHEQRIMDTISNWTSYTIETLFGIVITLVGWAGFRLYNRVDKLENKVTQLEIDLAELKSIKQELYTLSKTITREFNKQEDLITTLINKIPN